VAVGPVATSHCNTNLCYHPLQGKEANHPSSFMLQQTSYGLTTLLTKECFLPSEAIPETGVFCYNQATNTRNNSKNYQAVQANYPEEAMVTLS
jgi:hypothetical protein